MRMQIAVLRYAAAVAAINRIGIGYVYIVWLAMLFFCVTFEQKSNSNVKLIFFQKIKDYKKN